MNPLMLLFQLWLAMLITVCLHEFGHFGKKIIMMRWLPIPEGASIEARSRYGGLTVNALIFLGVWHYKPEMLFLQMIGLMAWAHFIFYAIVGSVNHEPKVPKHLWKYFVFDDIPNEFSFVFIPLGIVVFWYLKDYYVPILISLIQGVI